MTSTLKPITDKDIIMNNVNTNLEEIFKTLFPMDNIDPEGFVINSRDLHKAMNVGRDYNTWIKGRISKYNLKEGFDYTVIENLSSPNLTNPNSRSQVMIDYYVTTDVARVLVALETLRDKKSSSDNIYLIQNTSTKSVKIGVSKDIESRLKSLQTGHEHQLKLIYTKPVEDASSLELKLHHKFSDKRVRGEWFKVNPKKVIKEIEEFTFKRTDHLKQKLT